MMVKMIKKQKEQKKCVIKRGLKFNDYRDCLLNNETILKSQQRFESERHDVYNEEINKTALSSDDDKRLQTFDRITSYPYGASAGKVCKTDVKQSRLFRHYNFAIIRWPYIPDHPYRILIVQNTHCRWFWIGKNKCIIESNKQSTRY